MSDLEARVHELEGIVLLMSSRIDSQDAEIARLKRELSMVQTESAIASLTPWPSHVVAIARR